MDANGCCINKYDVKDEILGDGTMDVILKR